MSFTKHRMRHLVVLLPGIMGSVLQRNGVDVWALSGQALWQYLQTLPAVGAVLQALRIENDNWHQDTLGDGVVATRLIEDIHAVPGIVEHAGYGPIRRGIAAFFDVTEGSIHFPRPEQNFFAFPYDWRRDNRNSALCVQRFIENQLPRWRMWSGASDAQAILIGHSMGGLVARYYVEVLDGWRDTRALISVGTPHRGSVKSLDTLSNGIKMFITDLSNVVRSMNSVYQLIPTYPCVLMGDKYVRVADAGQIPYIDVRRAISARAEFHEVIRTAANHNAVNAAYRQRTMPWVGTRQETFQSARIRDGRLQPMYDPPTGLEHQLADGDGTVPRVSATPADLDGQQFERYAVERHGWITNTSMTLQPLLDTLLQLTSVGTAALHGGDEDQRPAICLGVDSVYRPEDVVLRVTLIDTDRPHELYVHVELVSPVSTRVTRQVTAVPGENIQIALPDLAPGLYRVVVQPQTNTLNAPMAVHGLFEVVEASTHEWSAA